jgi:2-oxo-4-hydroxy-4-carboxy-5-ureidoimidazoline decarboxylase
MEKWRQIDTASAADARALLTTACASRAWIDRMLARRPFGSREALLAAARAEWFALAPADWLEAFSHHPKIGERTADRLAATEQAGVNQATKDVLIALAEANRIYEAKFGYIFIVCATGKTAEEMLALLRARLPNDPSTEIRIAAEEQNKITALRLSAS